MATLGQSTLTIPHSGGNIVLNRVNPSGYGCEYYLRDSGGTFEHRCKVRHFERAANAYGLVYNRHQIELARTLYEDGDTPPEVRKVYLVMDAPRADSDVELADALCDLLIATTDEALDELMAWVS